MHVAEDLCFADGYAVYRPVGEFALQAAVAAVTQVIELCRQHQVKRLLIDGTRVTGFNPPSVSQRYEMASQWTMAGRGLMKVAVIVRQEVIDSEKFGVTVAKNRGARADVFTSETEALAWLLNPQTDRSD